MNCLPEFTYAIYADGELSPEEAREVESHLVHCPRCLKLVQALQAENRLLAAVLDEVEVSAPLTARPLQPAVVLWLVGAALALVGGLQVGMRAWAVPGWASGASWLNPLSLTCQLSLFFGCIFYLLEKGVEMITTVVNIGGVSVLGALLITGTILLLRRHPKSIGVMIALVITACLSMPAYALERRSGATITVRDGETIDGTLVATGENVYVDGVINGDLIAFSRHIALKGTVKGDLIGFCQSLDLGGTVEGNIYSGAQLVSVRGAVTRDAYAFAQRLQLEPEGRIQGDVIAFCGEANIEGAAGRDVSTFAESTNVRGSIGRDLTVRGDRLNLLGPARIGGNLTAYINRKKENVNLDSGAVIAGKTNIRVVTRPSRFTRPRFYFWQALQLGAAFLTGLITFWIFPFLFGSSLTTTRAVAITLLAGFLLLIAAPVAAVLAAVTLVGIPIAVVIGMAYIVAFYLAKIIVANLIGKSLLRQPASNISSFAWALLLGLLLIFVVTNVPYLGGVIYFLVVILGLGAVFSQCRLHWNSAVRP